jgi:hypothetical protein
MTGGKEQCRDEQLGGFTSKVLDRRFRILFDTDTAGLLDGNRDSVRCFFRLRLIERGD